VVRQRDRGRQRPAAGGTVDVAGIKLVRRKVQDLDKDALRGVADSLKAKITSGVVILACSSTGGDGTDLIGKNWGGLLALPGGIALLTGGLLVRLQPEEPICMPDTFGSAILFAVIFEDGGSFREYAPTFVPSCFAPASSPARQRIRCRSGSECRIAGGQPLV
jgi:hypothetical protein